MPLGDVSRTTATAPVPGMGTAPSRTPTQTLGKDQFLKLLAGQLRHQDPMSAKGGEEHMAQMTQLAILEQIQNLSTHQQTLTMAAATDQAVALVGKQVTYEGADGEQVTGTVEKVVFADGQAKLVIAGGEDAITLGDVLEVR